ncbi:hypothetical protein [Chryseobacterium sp. MMS23-Vi53]|uniref:hypothetical protein n=1 Tax=Chryseobacterium sp. MMS23-Vi53 TaxID=3386644 RepID=UPI0039EA4D62
MMKKLMIMSAFALFASASLTNTQVQAKEGGYIYESGGCYFHVVTHSMLWGLITWEEDPRPLGCGSGFA